VLLRRRYRNGRRRGVGALDFAITLVLLFSAAWIAAYFINLSEETAGGEARVIDGDTLAIGARVIRLRGIDAPEREQYCMNGAQAYPCGARSMEALRMHARQQALDCRGHEEDRYGRLLAVCRAGDRDLSAAMVLDGWAVAYGGYQAEEAVARKNGAGIWAGSFEMPREWRLKRGLMVDIGPVNATSRALNMARRALGLGGGIQ
jgi:endonuclease YncB( thermonuclease family)